MQAPVGHFVDFVLRADSVVQTSIETGPNVGSLYLQVSGVDMDGEGVGPLRLWNHVEGDIEPGNICILRGLKVATENTWNGHIYVPGPHGAKKLVCDARTAVEDVSGNPDIIDYFQ